MHVEPDLYTLDEFDYIDLTTMVVGAMVTKVAKDDSFKSLDLPLNFRIEIVKDIIVNERPTNELLKG